jgi:hypothetical protein
MVGLKKEYETFRRGNEKRKDEKREKEESRSEKLGVRRTSKK